MGNQRHAKEQVNEIDLTVLTARVDRDGKVIISDTHDRLGTILSDRRTGVERYPARYSPSVEKEYYPGGSDCNIDGTNPLNVNLSVSDAVPVNVFQPAVGSINDIEYIFIETSPLALARQLIVRLTDGVNAIPIWNSGVLGLLTGTTGLIHPDDETGLATYLQTRNTFRVWNDVYLEAEAIGFAPAELVIITVHNVPKDIGGLRE